MSSPAVGPRGTPAPSIGPFLDSLPPSERPYVQVHFARFCRLAELLRELGATDLEIGNVGVSPFDLLATSVLGWREYYTILPNSGFDLRYEPIYSNLRFVTYDIAREGTDLADNSMS